MAELSEVAPRSQMQLEQMGAAEGCAGDIGVDDNEGLCQVFLVQPSSGSGKGGGRVGEERSCLGRYKVSLKHPDLGPWADTRLRACKPESYLIQNTGLGHGESDTPWSPLV